MVERELLTKFGLDPCSGFRETFTRKVYGWTDDGRTDDGRLRHDSSSAVALSSSLTELKVTACCSNTNLLIAQNVVIHLKTSDFQRKHAKKFKIPASLVSFRTLSDSPFR